MSITSESGGLQARFGMAMESAGFKISDLSPDIVRLMEDYVSGKIFPVDFANGLFHADANRLSRTLHTFPEELFGFDEKTYDKVLGTLSSAQRVALVLSAQGHPDHKIKYALGKDIPNVKSIMTVIKNRCDAAVVHQPMLEMLFKQFLRTGFAQDDSRYLAFWSRLLAKKDETVAACIFSSPEIFVSALERLVKIQKTLPDFNVKDVPQIVDRNLISVNDRYTIREEVGWGYLRRSVLAMRDLGVNPSDALRSAVAFHLYTDKRFPDIERDGAFCSVFLNQEPQKNVNAPSDIVLDNNNLEL